jgi:hypothetical protein
MGCGDRTLPGQLRKKNQKTFDRLGATVRPAPLQKSKSFLLLFFKKEVLP